MQQQIADRIKKANNILVTVSANPSVDQLAACIGLTLVCNKLGKHATAVFSGEVPSVIEFLQPEKTIEKNTDSLRDFIIALDKAKADKLRYKVEDKVVKIFITPYRTSISEKDLDFSQGDFNVDVILALGVHNQADLDQAITAHGRILHDATVATINVAPGGELGAMNWLDAGASSLSELATELADALDQKLIDGQIATAFLTGIVAETDRFSNAKTSPRTMSLSAELMSLGANQQLVASKLEVPAMEPAAPRTPLAQTPPPPKNDDGTLEIKHVDDKTPDTAVSPAEPTPGAETEPEPEMPKPTPQIHIDEHGELLAPPAEEVPAGGPLAPQHIEGPRLITQPPTFASELTANTAPEGDEQPSGNPLSLPKVEAPMPLLNRTPLAQTPPPDLASPIGRTIEPPKPADAAAVPQPTPSLTQPALDNPLPPTPLANPLPPTPPLPSITAPMPVITPAPPAFVPPAPKSALPSTPPAPQQRPDETLTQIEQDVHSPHLNTPLSAPPLPPAPSGSPMTPAPPASAGLPPAMPSFAPQQPANPLPPAPAPFPAPGAAPLGSPNPTPWTPPTPIDIDAPAADASATAEDKEDSIEAAREAVNRAISQAQPEAPAPIQALNAQALGAPLHDDSASAPPNPTPPFSLPGAVSPSPNTSVASNDPGAPPPVPPPMMPQSS